MDADLDFATVFATESELRELTARLAERRTELRAALTDAFRRRNADTLRNAGERPYPLTTPEKQAVRRETAGPVTLFPEWEERYEAVADDERAARERLAAFHRDVFAALAAAAPYDLQTEADATVLDRPYLTVRARGERGVVVLELDAGRVEGYTYRTTAAYTERDVENALRLCESLAEVDLGRFDFLTHDTALVDATVGAGATDPDRLRDRLRVEILEGLAAVDYEYVETDDSPVLAFLEACEAAGLAAG